jgi:hypothetical protein
MVTSATDNNTHVSREILKLFPRISTHQFQSHGVVRDESDLHDRHTRPQSSHERYTSPGLGVCSFEEVIRFQVGFEFDCTKGPSYESWYRTHMYRCDLPNVGIHVRLTYGQTQTPERDVIGNVGSSNSSKENGVVFL